VSIYKYLATERIDVLRNGKIRFTQANALNDPFELSPYFEELIAKSRLLDELTTKPMDLGPHLRQSYEELPAELKSFFSYEQMVGLIAANPEAISSAIGEGLRVVLGVFDQQMPKLKEMFFERLRSEFGILSLTEAPDNVLMWSLYAAEHRGFLIEFDEKHPFFNQRRGPEDEFYHLRRVNYIDRQQFRDIMEVSGEDVLLAKGPEWTYEREWRMVRPLALEETPINTPMGLVYLVPFPPEAVTGVVLGSRMTPAMRDELISLLAEDVRYQHVALYEAVLNQKTGGVDIKAWEK